MPAPASASPPASALLLLLADSRLPVGGHAHSGGIEAAVAAGLVDDEPSLERFCASRLATSGLVTAALAAAACRVASAADGLVAERGSQLAELDAEADARTASPALRTASRAQGRALLRAAGALVDEPLPLARADPHQPVALGMPAGMLGMAGAEIALVVASAAVSGPASAALRLLGLDPVGVMRMQAGLAEAIDAVARRADSLAGQAARHGPAALPAAAAPVLDLLAERHAARSVRLFAS